MKHHTQRALLWLAMAAVLGLSALAVTGCRQPAAVPEPSQPTPSTPATTEPAPSQEETQLARLYLVRAEKIGVEGTAIKKTDAVDRQIAEALDALVSHSPDSDPFGLGTAIPAGTKVNDVEVDGDTVTVDLSKTFETGGGSLSMQLRVAQVVYTATQFDGVRRVSFKLDGDPVKAIGGEGFVVDPALTREACENVTPAILLESPLPGDTISSPVTISGTANVFEAQFRAKVSDGMGDTLVQQPVKASSGTGTRGVFSDELSFMSLGPGVGSVSVFDLSEKDGSVTDKVTIPIKFE